MIAALAAKYTAPGDRQYLPDADPAFDVVYAVRPQSAMMWRLDDYAGSRRRWPARAIAVAPLAQLPPDKVPDVTMIARFQVDSFEPRQVVGLGADWFGLMTFAKTFTSGITGQSTTLFMSASTEEGSRSYVATERISGRTDDGREGAVTVQHGGLESEPDSWFGHIVPGTGTGDFAGWSGSARIVHDDQGAYFEITLA